MLPERQLLDANILVRFFIGEPAEMAEKVRRLVERADQGEVILVVLPVILAETFFTRESFYKIPRKEVAKKLSGFLQAPGIEVVESFRVIDALNRCEERNAHFADAYLAATSAALNYPVSSFDRDFNKFNDIQRSEPF